MGQGPINTVQEPFQGTQVKPGIAAATLVKGTSGRVMSINVIAPGTALSVFTIYDSATVAGTAGTNEVYASAVSTALTVGQQIDLDWPITSGIVVVPGTGATVAVSYL